MEIIIAIIGVIVGIPIAVWALWQFVKLLVYFIVCIWSVPFAAFSYFRFLKIKMNSFDIENTGDCFKIIRNKKGKYGLCFWEDYGKCKILLYPKYKLIGKYPNSIYILENRNKMGIYNADLKKYIAKCKYEKIIIESDDMFELHRHGRHNKINYLGDRIVD